jgi:hypothetical protein
MNQAIRRASAATRTAGDLHAFAHMVECQTNSDCPGTGNTCTSVPVGGLNSKTKKVCGSDPDPAHGIERVPADYGPVPWDGRFQNDRKEFWIEVAKARRQYQAALECRNPLGIEKWDLPLYFSDTSGVNTSSFAASDYLIERVAAPAVAESSGRFASTRNAWLSARNSEIQAQQTQQERSRRLEDLQLSYGQSLIEMCGLYGIPALDVLGRFALLSPDPNRLDPASCWRASGANIVFHGTVGQRAQALESAELEVRHAHESSAEAVKRYEERDHYCTEIENDNDSLRAALKNHQARVKSLRDDLAQFAQLETATSTFTGILVGGATQTPTGGSADGPTLAIDTLRANTEAELLDSDQRYEAAFLDRTLKKEEGACWLEASALRDGIRKSVRDAESAVENARMANLQLKDGIGTIRELVSTATARIEREKARVVSSVAHNYWVDEDLEEYRKSFERAQRYVYLGMLAVEYEFQESLGMRDQILTAKKPADLEDALAILRAEVAARSINGRRPEESTVVLSLRRDILDLEDEKAAVGERGWTSVQRFGARLMAPQYAVFADDGTYLGQGIPFTLEPVGALAYRCAERVWRLNATLQVDALGVVEPSVPVMLLKKNTFASQYCAGHGGGTPYQVTSMRPNAQLISGGGQAVDAEANAFSASLMHAWLNVPRSEFYQDAYRNGSTTELAGRGLYGDYVLLFPEKGLLELTNPANEDFPLRKVEDVLLRFDLVSVDNLQGQ